MVGFDEITWELLLVSGGIREILHPRISDTERESHTHQYISTKFYVHSPIAKTFTSHSQDSD